MNLFDGYTGDTVRPVLPGVVAVRDTPGIHVEHVAGLGAITHRKVGDAGLIVPVLDSHVALNVKSALYLVLAVGPDDPDCDWSMAEHGIRRGVSVCATAAADDRATASQDVVPLRQSGIAAIGQPKGSHRRMLPAPGWAVVEAETVAEERPSGIVIRNQEVAERATNAGETWGLVYALPRDYQGDLWCGARVAIEHAPQAERFTFKSPSGTTLWCVREAAQILGVME